MTFLLNNPGLTPSPTDTHFRKTHTHTNKFHVTYKSLSLSSCILGNVLTVRLLFFDTGVAWQHEDVLTLAVKADGGRSVFRCYSGRRFESLLLRGSALFSVMGRERRVTPRYKNVPSFNTLTLQQHSSTSGHISFSMSVDSIVQSLMTISSYEAKATTEAQV